MATNAQPASASAGGPDKIGYIAAALMFSPVGLLVGMVQNKPWGLGVMVVMVVFSALMSVGYIYCFSRFRRNWWALIPLNLAPWFLPEWLITFVRMSGLSEIGSGMSDTSRRITMAVGTVVLVSLGFAAMMRHLVATLARTERLRTEMALAERIHQKLVPPIRRRGAPVEVLGRSEASSEMGGDLIDVVEHEAGVDLYLADVSGHGVRAGVLMAMIKSAIRAGYLEPEATLRPLGEGVARLNRLVAQVADPDMFATIACVRIRPDQKVEYAMAGHLPILLARAGGEVIELDNMSLPLGVDVDETFDSRTVSVERGDLLVLLTDGLVEAINAAGRQFGMDGVRAEIASRSAQDLPAMYEAVLGAVRAHGVQIDDQTLLLARIV